MKNRKKTYLLRKLALLLFSGGILITCSVFAQEVQDEVECDALRQALKTGGWRIELTEDGSVVLFPPEPGKNEKENKATRSADNPSIPVAGIIDVEDVQGLRYALEQSGWNVEENEGGLLVFPPKASQMPGSSPEKRGAQNPGNFNLDMLAEELMGAGWRTQRDADDSLLIFPELNTADTLISESADAMAHDDSGRRGNAKQTLSPNFDLDSVAERLVATGWQVSREVGGSIIARWPDASAKPSPPVNLAALRDQLSETGWQVEEGAAGEILLFPRQEELLQEPGTFKPAPESFPDRDGDGVVDTDDFCLEKLDDKRVNMVGCGSDRILLKGVTFEFNSPELTQTARQKLERYAAVIKRHPNLDYAVVGYTDNIGSKRINKMISRKRANSVKGYLESLGVSGDILAAYGRGEDEPVASNETGEGRSANRRVELHIVGIH